MVKLLGEYGAQVDIRGNTGSTAFDIANMIGQNQLKKSSSPDSNRDY